MTGISTLHAASLLRRHDMKLDSHGEMGTLGNLKFAAVGGTAPSRRADFLDKIRIRLGALKDVLFSTSQQRADMRAKGEALRAQKRCGHLFGKLTASMADGASVASVDKTLRRMTDRMPAGDVDGKWRGPLQNALAKVNAKDLEAMRDGLRDLEQAYPVSVGQPPDNARALVELLKSMLAPVEAGTTGDSPVPAQATEASSASATASASTASSTQIPIPTPVSAQAPGAATVGDDGGSNPPQGLIPPPPPPPPPPVAKSPAPKPEPFSGPDQASTERSHSDVLADAIRNPQLRKATPPDEAGAKPSHQDALLDAIRNPQLRSREQTDEIVKKIVEKDKAKVDAAKDKALTPEQKKLGGLHGGLMDEIKGTEGLSPSQLKGRAKKRVVDSPETPMSKASSGS